MNDFRYLTSRQAADALGVSLDTLYAYVSRGMLRSEEASGPTRTRRYLREDVERLVERKRFRREPEKAGERSLHWGSPVLESALTLIDAGCVYYCGRDALNLARCESVERVAALLWTGNPDAADDLFRASGLNNERRLLWQIDAAADLGPIERCQVALARASARDLGAYDLRPAPVAQTGARILRLMAYTVTGHRPAATLDATLGQAWAPKRPRAGDAMRSALILCADHELNVSAFTARCVASAQATPYDVVSAGLAALKGRLHGGHTARVEALFREAGTPARARDRIARRVSRGEDLPGFGHPLYPEGDPRAAMLLAIAERAGGVRGFRLAAAIRSAVREISGQQPTIDFGLVSLARAFGLPPQSPIALFALGRTIGWIAHAIEQYSSNRLIRPRARYIGVTPSG